MKWGQRSARYKDATATGVRLEKGSTINRIAEAGDEKKGGMKYAAFKPEDIENYEFILGGSNKFNFQYTLKETLISPSEKRQCDAFLEIIGEMSVKKAASILKKKSKLSTLRGIEKELTKAVNGNEKSVVKTYDKFTELLYAKELEPIRRQYFSKLSAEGYNMIIDSSDKGSISDVPLLIFSGNKSLAFTSKKRIEE
jgi:hypothetical protein